MFFNIVAMLVPIASNFIVVSTWGPGLAIAESAGQNEREEYQCPLHGYGSSTGQVCMRLNVVELTVRVDIQCVAANSYSHGVMDLYRSAISHLFLKVRHD